MLEPEPILTGGLRLFLFYIGAGLESFTVRSWPCSTDMARLLTHENTLVWATVTTLVLYGP